MYSLIEVICSFKTLFLTGYVLWLIRQVYNISILLINMRIILDFLEWNLIEFFQKELKLILHHCVCSNFHIKQVSNQSYNTDILYLNLVIVFFQHCINMFNFNTNLRLNELEKII